MGLPNGISANDFIRGPLKDFGRPLSYYAPTVTVKNSSGKRTITYAAASTITIVFHVRKLRHTQDEEGNANLGDAYVMARPADNIAQWGKIQDADGKIYQIAEVQRRPNSTNPMFDFAECYLLDDA